MQLPTTAQVNNDPAAGINPQLGVSGEDPTNADVVGGALTAGKVAVPWAIFRQHETSPAKDQIFSRSFAGGAWTTRGTGTVGGRSSASPTFSGSLNFDQTQDGEAPGIDFAGTGRTVPWATWYENTTGTGFANNNIFASRFDNTAGDPNIGKWIFAGQSRGTGGGTVSVPSLNIHTNQDAENPAVAGGSAGQSAGAGSVGDLAGDRHAAGQRHGSDLRQPSARAGDGQLQRRHPGRRARRHRHRPRDRRVLLAAGRIPRVGAGGADPSLNVDPTRNGIEPDIAFTGPSDAVPWVVWYETGPSATTGRASNELVFAAKGISDGLATDGGFHWVVVGRTRRRARSTRRDSCDASLTAEQQCSLNKNPANDAEDPQVAAGTMNPANPTVPWVTWDETLNGVKQVFVSRLVGAGFQLVNNGAPISVGANDSTRPDITFSGNTPYVTWRENTGGGVEMAFVGHFINAANPTFVLDESDTSLAPTTTADVREPISSSCTANPFNSDGAACQGSAIGTPFFLSTNPSLQLIAERVRADHARDRSADRDHTDWRHAQRQCQPPGCRSAGVVRLRSHDHLRSDDHPADARTRRPGGPVLSRADRPHRRPSRPLRSGHDDRLRNGRRSRPDAHHDRTTTPWRRYGHGGRRHRLGHRRRGPALLPGNDGSDVQGVADTDHGQDDEGPHADRRCSSGKEDPYDGHGRNRVCIADRGSSQTVTVSLNRAGQKLLGQVSKLPAKLVVTQTLASGQSTTISSQTVAFKGKKHHRKHHKRHR